MNGRNSALLLIFILFLSACGDSEGGLGQACYPNDTCNAGLTCDVATNKCEGTNCRAPERSCHPPLVCEVLPTTGEHGCKSPGDVPTCSGSPAGQVVPFATVVAAGNKTIHWMLTADCIATSYEQALSDRASEIGAAVGSLNAIDCARICLESPVLSPLKPEYMRGERRIHFRLATADDLTSMDPAVVTAYYEMPTGRMMSVEVVVRDLEQLQPSDFLQSIGFAIGLDAAPSGSDSIMEPFSSPRAVTTMTTADRAAICALYGNPGYCGE